MAEVAKAASVPEARANELRETVEYYFSDANLLTDVHLHGLMSKSESSKVALAELLKFPRLKRLVKKILTADPEKDPKSPEEILVECLSKSDLLEVEGTSVGRHGSRPLPPSLPRPGGPLTHLVLDSGAIIHGLGSELRAKAENFWTIPEVIAEVRDKRSRKNLESLPFELHTKEPSEEAMGFIVRYSRASGDYATMSLVDLKVLALTYMLEAQESGTNHLRPAPKPMPAPPKRAPCPAPGSTRSGKLPAQAPSVNPLISDGASGKAEQPAVEEPSEPHEKGDATVSDDAAVAKTVSDDEGSDADDRDERLRAMGASGDGANEEAEEEAEVEAEEEAESLGSADEWDPSALEGPEKQFDSPTGKGVEGQFDDEDDEEADDGAEFDDRLFTGAVQQPPASKVGFEGEDKETPEQNYEFDPGAFPTLGKAESSAGFSASASEKGSSWGAAGKGGGAGKHIVDFPRTNPREKKSAVVTAFEAKIPGDPSKDSAALALTSAPTSVEALKGPSPGPTNLNPSLGRSRVLGSAATGISSAGWDDDDGSGWFHPGNLASSRASGADMLGHNKVQIAGTKQTGPGTFKPGENPSSSAEKKKGGGGPSSPGKEGAAGGGGGGGSGSAGGPNGGGPKGGGKKGPWRPMKRGPLVARAGCVTTDFAMQTVLLSVGLKLLTVDGLAVRRVNQFVLRCNACFLVETNTEKLFCSRCGSARLSRVAASVDPKTGEQKLFMKKDYKHRLQGTKFPLPKPGGQRGGRFGGELVLREDQTMMGIWAQKVAPKAKEKTSMFGAEVNEKTGVQVRKSAHTVVVGFGRQNPNAAKGRERRGKKKRAAK